MTNPNRPPSDAPCLDGDALVYLTNGEKVPIKDITRLGLVSQVWTTNKTYPVFTENHPVFVEGKGWVKAKDLVEA